ncbi:hypothetical protein BN871_EN_00110 [Paenibacillus sp. P22]|nr:hypothetical protein BN871_EN_00110 [Paenibacillus sp. P22]
MPLSSQSEHIARNSRHAMLLHEPFREFLRAQPCRGDRREGIEGSLRLVALQADVAQPFDDEAAALVVRLHHAVHLFHAVRQRLQRGDLRHVGGAHDRVLMDLEHRADQLGMAACVADPPARHGERLGEAADQNRAVLHSRHGGEADMLASIGQLGIDLVGDDDQIMLLHDLGDRQPVLVGHDAAGRIARIAEDQNFGAGRDRRPQRVGLKLEGMLRECFHPDGDSAGERRNRRIRNVARLRNENLVTGTDQSPQSEVDRFAAADRYENFLGRVVRDAERVVQVLADRSSELRRAGVGRILRLARFQRGDAGVADMPRSDEVRLAYAKRDHILAAVRQIEKPADSGWLDRPGARGQVVGHGTADRRFGRTWSLAGDGHDPSTSRSDQQPLIPFFFFENDAVLLVFLQDEKCLGRKHRVDRRQLAGDERGHFVQRAALHLDEQIVRSRHQVDRLHFRIQVDPLRNAFEAAAALGRNLNLDQSRHFLVVHLAPVDYGRIFDDDVILFHFRDRLLHLFLWLIKHRGDQFGAPASIFLKQLEHLEFHFVHRL